MKQTKLSLILGLTAVTLLGGLSSCYRDDSRDPRRTLAIAQPETTLASSYAATYGQELVLSAPHFTLPAGSYSDVRYEWMVNYRVVGTDSTLRYTPNAYGDLPARLRIYTEDGSHSEQFTIQVQTPYRQGLYVLGGTSSSGYVSYFPLGEQADFEADVFAKNNSLVGALPAAPQELLFFTQRTNVLSGTGTGMATLTFGSPTRAYRMNADRMQIAQAAINFGSATVTAAAQTHSPEFMEYYVTGSDLWLLRRDTETTPVHDVTARLRAALRSGATLALSPVASPWLDTRTEASVGTPAEGYVARSRGVRAAGAVLFNSSSSDLIVTTSETARNARFVRVLEPSLGSLPDATDSWRNFADNPFEGTAMVSMSSTEDLAQVLLLYRTTATGAHRLLLLRPVDYLAQTVVNAGTSAARVVSAVYPRLNPISYTQSEAPTKAITRDGARAFVAAGSKVYFYNLQSGSSTDYLAGLAADAKPGTAEAIVDLIQPSAERLYVATNQGSTGYVYCYDVSSVTPQLLWKSAAFSAPITRLSYRN